MCKKRTDKTLGPDECLGWLEGVHEACCGHGEKQGYLLFQPAVPVGEAKPDYSNFLAIHFPVGTSTEAIKAVHRAILDLAGEQHLMLDQPEIYARYREQLKTLS